MKIKSAAFFLYNIFCLPIIIFGQSDCNCYGYDEHENLIAHFPFDGNSIEAIGMTFNGKVKGAKLSTGFDDSPKTAYIFDGLNDEIHVGDHFDMNEESFSISCWVNVFDFEGLTPGTNSYGGWIINKGITIFGSPKRAGYALDARKHGGENQLNFFVGGQDDQVYRAGASGFEEHKWYFIVAVKDEGRISLYVDNKLVSSVVVPENLNVETNIPLVFGSIDKLGNDPAGTTYFFGKIDDVKIYKKALICEESNCLAVPEPTPIEPNAPNQPGEPCQKPKIDLGNDQIINCIGEIITLDASFPEAKYEWQDGSSNPTFSANKSGTYSVKVENSCGVVYDTITIHLNESDNFQIPNVFTPNHDVFNQFFQIDKRLFGSKLKIYQRTGKVVYQSNHYKNDWDGKNVDKGTYFFVLENPCFGKFTGWVHVLY